MLIKIACTILVVLLSACSRTENGLVFGKPAYEERDIAVSGVDIEILLQTQSLLSSKQAWSKDGQRKCSGLPPYSLYCALETASKTVDGKYIHRRPALQEVRFTIDDQYKNRWKIHRLADFNSHPDTTYDDVMQVLRLTIEHVQQKIRDSDAIHNASSASTNQNGSKGLGVC